MSSEEGTVDITELIKDRLETACNLRWHCNFPRPFELLRKSWKVKEGGMLEGRGVVDDNCGRGLGNWARVGGSASLAAEPCPPCQP